jgi:hypothetical protein
VRITPYQRRQTGESAAAAPPGRPISRQEIIHRGDSGDGFPPQRSRAENAKKMAAGFAMRPNLWRGGWVQWFKPPASMRQSGRDDLRCVDAKRSAGGDMVKVRDQKDFWSGILFIVFGCAGLWFGRNYAVGTAARMGPGYFPMLMSLALVGIGGFILARSLIGGSGRIERIAVWPQLQILAAIVAFGLLIERVGLAVSVIAVIVISGIATQGLRWYELATLAVVMAGICVGLFVYLLGQPIPVWIR